MDLGKTSLQSVTSRHYSNDTKEADILDRLG